MKSSRLKTILVVFFISLFVFVPAMAEEYNADVVVSLQIDNPVMEVNGVETEIDLGRGTAPVISDGRTLVPIRAIIEAFNGEVLWDNASQAAILRVEEDTVKLTINSNTAFFNNVPYTLDTVPRIINDRTMLPIRFIAESFNLGVAWNNDTRTVFLVRNGFDEAEYIYLMNSVPEYSGNAYVTVNNNYPLFKEYEIIPASFEFYANLDELGRCDVTMASVAADIMPTDERESISSITPTGWINKTYDSVPGGYLYNRCHLIGYQLTGENANKRNLITGTRYLNIDGMLPFENMVDSYIDRTGNHVMYRVTPVFEENNLVADGVLMEAYSIEDNGTGISFCVFCYNVQPSVVIDYSTGESISAGSSWEPPVQNIETDISATDGVYRTPAGKRYHFLATCGGENSYLTVLEEAQAAGLTPCQKCAD